MLAVTERIPLNPWHQEKDLDEFQTVGKDWASSYRLPEPGNMMEKHENREQVFVNQGTAMADAVIKCIKKYTKGRSIRANYMLDFGCGVGRVALPFFHAFSKPDRCVDVDPTVIEYLKREIPGTSPAVSNFDPPLDMPDNEFDIIYSISVWTHLPADSADKWLRELRRILKPGGLALVTTSNYAVLDLRRKHPVLGPMGWSSVKDEDLKKEGFLFKKTPSTPGTGTYGMASHDPVWLKREWSKYMPVIGFESGAILGVQDINIMQKPYG